MHAQVKNFQRGPAKNYNGLVRYTNILTARYARLLVIRIDLSFLELYREGVSLEEFFEYREKLLGDRRYRPFLKDIVGHAWSLEYAKKTGYHYHMLFFYDGSKHREDITIGMGIGEQWKKITGGKGRYYLCNHKKGSYRFCGIGVVDYHDRIACENLNKAIAYLTKPQLFAKVTGFLEARVRSFGRGVLPKMSPRKGRPRRKGIHLIS
ncbi:inovirus-type Gp2 protein [Aeromonas hydrophila]|uniref:YagK/YfjJ domain-containing protein n=1 Tax=Aeromonas hydrophila TaxID=644 RepID=UPI001C055B56|nr:inovirus-type Gp2 protein [Aeromonas hydrophila]QWL80762.1 inovirus-type Gp2 protein [Aeromonas hydrophila]